jgi:GntR family phosphonate transport system transcriptional regulator
MQAAHKIRERIEEGILRPGERMPSSHQIAEEFAINRMTARRALAELEKDGLLRILHGNGTFVADTPISYAIGARVRFDQNLKAVGATPERKIIRHWLEPANEEVAVPLALTIASPVIAIEIGAYASGHPIGIGRRYCCATRFAGFAEIFDELGSISMALKQFNIADFHRASTIVVARMPTTVECDFLRSSRSQPVLAYTAIDEAPADKAISYFTGCFSARAVEIHITS